MIGILGGTFDPIHHGHLRIALDAAEVLGLSEIRLIPLGQAVHREQPVANSEQRLEMLRLAIGGHPLYRIDDREIRRGGPSYMIDTLRSLRADLPGETLCLLLGSDAYEGFMQWRDPEGILALANLAILFRPGEDRPQDAQLTALATPRLYPAERLSTRPAGAIAEIPVTQLDIASSDIRQRFREGRDPSWLLPDPVIDYIHTKGLYR
jgi:nicotinate-nucleotide adenylyltransferase